MELSRLKIQRDFLKNAKNIYDNQINEIFKSVFFLFYSNHFMKTTINQLADLGLIAHTARRSTECSSLRIVVIRTFIELEEPGLIPLLCCRSAN